MRVDFQVTVRGWNRTVTAIYASALLFVVSGSAVILLSRSDRPPALDQLTRTTDLVRAKRVHANAKGAPYLELTTGGGRYTLDSWRRGWLDSVSGALPVGQGVTVWSRDAPNGTGRIFQIQRGDSLVVRYRERQQRTERNNRNSIVIGEVMILVGVAGGIGGLIIGRLNARRRSRVSG